MNAPCPRATFARSERLAAILPACTDPAEVDLRERLLCARDIATANLASLTGHAATLNLMIVETAGRYVFAPVDISTLRRAVEQCRRLMACSAGADQLENQQ